MPQGLDGVDTGSARGGVKGGSNGHNDGEGYSTEPKIRWKREEVDVCGALWFKHESECQTIRNRINYKSCNTSNNTAKKADKRGFDKKDQLDFTVLSADRLHDSDLSGSFQDRHDHRVGNTERCNQKRDSTEQAEDGIHDQKNRPQLLEFIHYRKRSKSNLG